MLLWDIAVTSPREVRKAQSADTLAVSRANHVYYDAARLWWCLPPASVWFLFPLFLFYIAR